MGDFDYRAQPDGRAVFQRAVSADAEQEPLAAPMYAESGYLAPEPAPGGGYGPQPERRRRRFGLRSLGRATADAVGSAVAGVGQAIDTYEDANMVVSLGRFGARRVRSLAQAGADLARAAVNSDVAATAGSAAHSAAEFGGDVAGAAADVARSTLEVMHEGRVLRAVAGAGGEALTLAGKGVAEVAKVLR